VNDRQSFVKSRHRWHYLFFTACFALADSDHHRGNAVLFALALMCSRDGRSAFFHSLYNAASRHAQAVALADKIARMAWAIMVRGERYKEPNLLLAA